ncbi:hypothetical protein AAFF_G00076330 [Aldrovandia affinis]|uniref:Uncharacterized protein n=1 Tax=Aldrovandia affinis TaxID=143900 RepID=A0AAD7RXT1_9TELE|nr:hypothetical protein AAFF_G00076330 [Aldrovandia affinis]
MKIYKVQLDLKENICLEMVACGSPPHPKLHSANPSPAGPASHRMPARAPVNPPLKHGAPAQSTGACVWKDTEPLASLSSPSTARALAVALNH